MRNIHNFVLNWLFFGVFFSHNIFLTEFEQDYRKKKKLHFLEDNPLQDSEDLQKIQKICNFPFFFSSNSITNLYKIYKISD
jgi:hypothetical protein